ncbi:MAG: hypothetical protein WEB00_15950 [Dehalococcoidia bacterium]
MLEDGIGLIGMVSLVTAYLLNLAGRMRPDGMVYQLMNLVGAGILGWYGFAKETYIFVGLEAVWAAAALHAIVTRHTSRDDAAA